MWSIVTQCMLLLSGLQHDERMQTPGPPVVVEPDAQRAIERFTALWGRIQTTRPPLECVFSAEYESMAIDAAGEPTASVSGTARGSLTTVAQMWLLRTVDDRTTGAAGGLTTFEATTVIAHSGEIALQRMPGDVNAQFTDSPVLPIQVEFLGLLDQSLRCLLSGCGVSLDQILDSAHRITVLEEGDCERWTVDVRPNGQGRLIYELDLTRGEAPALTRFAKRIFATAEEGVPPALDTVATVASWHEVDGHRLPQVIESTTRITRSGLNNVGRRVIRVQSARIVDAAAARDACRSEARLREGEVGFDRSLRLKMAGGSRVFQIDNVSYLAPEPIWEHPGRDLVGLVSRSVRVPREAGPQSHGR